MNFCKICDNMLYMRISTDGDNKITKYCRNCCNNDDVTEIDPCLYKNHSEETTLYLKSLVNKFTPYDPTLPHSKEIPCPNPSCSNKETNDVVYLKYNKKDMKYLYLCCDCLTVWKCPSYEQKEILFTL